MDANRTPLERAFDLRTTPAMAAGLTTALMGFEDIVALIDAAAPQPGRPKTYKKRAPLKALDRTNHEHYIIFAAHLPQMQPLVVFVLLNRFARQAIQILVRVHKGGGR